MFTTRIKLTLDTTLIDLTNSKSTLLMLNFLISIKIFVVVLD